MGCAGSVVEGPQTGNKADNIGDNERNGNLQKNQSNSNALRDHDNNNIAVQNASNKKDRSPQKNSPNEIESNKEVPKAIAFNVELEKKTSDSSLIGKHPPKRLQRLAPLDDAPKLTTEQLNEKIRLAEEKRQEELEKKKAVSRKSSRIRQQLLEAKKFEAQQIEQGRGKEIENKLHSAEKNREAKMKELEEKKRQREEKAKRIRAKAHRLKVENGEEIDFEIEKDENFNAEDEDSWLEGESSAIALQSEPSGLSERIYSGRESPHKTIQVRSSEEHRARMSGISNSTSDSFDFAYQRKPPIAPVDSTTSNHDDFFDS